MLGALLGGKVTRWHKFVATSLVASNRLQTMFLSMHIQHEQSEKLALQESVKHIVSYVAVH